MDRINRSGLFIKKIYDELEKQSNNSLRSLDLTMAQLGVLLELKSVSEKQMSLKELEHLLHVAQSTAAGIVVRLEQKGFVKSFGSPDDKRIKIVSITPEGEQCCYLAYQCMEETEKKLLSGLTETESNIFLTLLQKVCDSIH